MVVKRKSSHNDSRDREASRAKLIEAVGKLLARKGFQSIGINAIAREAGLDKVLIYRYFGGLNGLISAFASEYDFWPSVEELVGGNTEEFSSKPLDERLSIITCNYMRAIRKRPLTREILSWMFMEQSETTKDLDAVRQRAGLELMEVARLNELDASIDAKALMAIIGASTNHLCTRVGKIRWFSGLDITSDADWQRLETMMVLIIKSVLSVQQTMEHDV